MKNFRSALFLTIIGWTLLAGAFLVFQINEEAQKVPQYARIQAQSSLNKDLSYRKWNSGHGGVYVPVTPTLVPNPYLTVPNRDVRTQGGQDLTLVNPAYMTRMVHEQSGELYGERGHITSLLPLRPENAPDPWEANALGSFESGAPEKAEVVREGTQDFFRLMIPLKAEASCLKCHGHQGYKVGDVRGGLSVAVSLKPYQENLQSTVLQDSLYHGVIWLLGVLGTIFAGLYIRKSFQNQKNAEDQVRHTLKQKEKLLQELQHRTNNNLSMIISLLEMQATTYGNQELKEAFTRVENRIRALSLVHNQLVGSQDLSQINLGRYTGELVSHLLSTRNPKAVPVTLTTQLEDVEVLIDSALPCGLILGEAVTNALIHGLPEDRGGHLTLKVSKNSDQEVVLEIQDNGPGLPPDLDPREVPSMGLSLIFLLAEQQLRGRVEYSRGPGFSLRITFRDNLYQTRI